MIGWMDIALVLVFAAAWPALEYFVLWPRHVRAVAAGDADARSRTYSRTLWEEWALAAAVVVLMTRSGRNLGMVGLHLPHGWRLWLGVALAAAYLVLIVAQARALSARPASLLKLKQRLQPLRALIPHTRSEFQLFIPLSITAGFCEELLFRGYLVWVLRTWMGLYPAAGVSMIAFGLAHGYQGAKFGIRAFLAGVAMGVLALVTGSLVPGMVLHAMIDMGSGLVTYMAMRTPDAPVVGDVAA
jgi:membrane protease YdiL (CAAX protease family)